MSTGQLVYWTKLKRVQIEKMRETVDGEKLKLSTYLHTKHI